MRPRDLLKNRRFLVVIAIAVSALFGQDFLTKALEVVNATAVTMLPPV